MPKPVHQVTFKPDDITVDVFRHGETLLRVAMAAGVHINASCGGNGTCGKCKVIVESGAVESKPSAKLSDEQWKQGYRLACMTKVMGDVVVTIPPESRIDNAALKARTGGKRHILKARDLNTLVQGLTVDPAVWKLYLELPPPTSDDNLSDLGRLMRELKNQHGLDGISTDFRLLTRLSQLLRDADWKVTTTLVYNPKGLKLIDVEPGDTTERNYSIIIDVGTTTVKGQLLDLRECRVAAAGKDCEESEEANLLAEDARYNSQVRFGEDVISRIVHSQKGDGLRELQQAVVTDINEIIRALLGQSGIDRENLSHMVVAGNTTMTQLLLGIDPKYIREDPYVPTANFFPPVRGIDIGLSLPEHIHLYTFPLVSSYVGGDIVAGILGSGIFQREELTLFIDIGTNGEIVLGNCDWLVCTSCSAGPAFEGGGVKHGMRATRGAIEQVRINPETFEPMVITIGNRKPLGICGSGLIDAVAEMLVTGIIEPNGKFNHDLGTPRVRKTESGSEFLLVPADETDGIGDIVITEGDLDNLIRTKGAIYAGCRILLESVGMTFAELDRLIIAGGFGQFINLERAITIGLLPEIPTEKFMFVGNGALLGARLVSFSREMMKDARRVAEMMTNIELANNMRFMDEYVAALFLPHTDTNAFPGVMQLIHPETAD
jgi:uncharacterized 2Fe-2S/4Fe-4S cluster protein (DUF4445 family)